MAAIGSTISPQLDINTVYDAIARAVSSNDAVRSSAEHLLAGWQRLPGFCSLLLTIVNNKQALPQCRFLSIILLKQTIENFWASSEHKIPGATIILDQEKTFIRDGLLNLLTEDCRPVAIQIALALGIIARHDYPNAWPDLLDRLAVCITSESSPPLRRLRALLSLHHIVSQLCAKSVLPTERSRVREIAPRLFTFVCMVWDASMTSVVNALTTVLNVDTLSSLAGNVEASRLCLKVIKTLLLHGFAEYHKHEDAVRFLSRMLERLVGLAAIRKNAMASPVALSQSTALQQLVDKLLVLMSGIAMETQQLDAVDTRVRPTLEFVQFLRPYLEFFYGVVMSYEPLPSVEGSVDEIDKNMIAHGKYVRFVMHAIEFIKDVIECPRYKPQEKSSLDESESRHAAGADSMSMTSEAASHILNQFFEANPNVLSDLCRHLVVKLFVLTAEDLREWRGDPEQFFNREEDVNSAGGGPLESDRGLRAWASALLNTLLVHFGSWLSPLVVDMLKRLAEKCAEQPITQEKILLRDAVLLAIGMSYNDPFVYEQINFNEWLVSELVPSMASSPVIRRRVTWLIGKWAASLCGDLWPSVYSLIVDRLLDDTEDLVVRLTAVDTLRSLIEEFGFQPSDFKPFMEKAIGALFRLLFGGVVTLNETKLRLMYILGTLVERMEDQIEPFAMAIIDGLSRLWEYSSIPGKNQDFLKTSVVRVLSKLVTALTSFPLPSATPSMLAMTPSAVGPERFRVIYKFVIPVIAYSINIDSPEHLYTMEDGLLLCLKLLKTLLPDAMSTTAPMAGTPGERVLPNELIDIFSNILKIIDCSMFDYVELMTKIIEAYVVVCPRAFMARFGNELFPRLQRLFNELNDRGLCWVLRPIAMTVLVFGPQCVAGEAIAVQVFAALQPVLGRVFELAVGRQPTQQGRESDITAQFITIFARVLLEYPEYFWRFLQAMGGTAAVGALLEQWTVSLSDSVSLLSSPFSGFSFHTAKLLGMGLCALLPYHVVPAGAAPLTDPKETLPHRLRRVVDVVILVMRETESSLLKLGYDPALITENDLGGTEPEDRLPLEPIAIDGSYYEQAFQRVAERDILNKLHLGSFLVQKLRETCSMCPPTLASAVVGTLEPYLQLHQAQQQARKQR